MKSFDFVFLFIGWSLAFYTIADLIVVHQSSRPIVPLSGKTEPITIIHNGSTLVFETRNFPTVIELAKNEFDWFFNIGVFQHQSFAAPARDGNPPCAFVQLEETPEVANVEDLQETLRSFKEQLEPSCFQDDDGYLLAFSKGKTLVAESQGVGTFERWKLPHNLWNPGSIRFAPDRTCFRNGIYGACFEFFSFKSLNPTMAFVILSIYALVYAICSALVDRIVFKSNFLGAARSFLLANYVAIVIGGGSIVLVASTSRLFSLPFEIPFLTALFLISALHFLRTVMLFGVGYRPSIPRRFIGAGLAFATTWTLGGVVFLPLTIVAIQFRDLVTQIF